MIGTFESAKSQLKKTRDVPPERVSVAPANWFSRIDRAALHGNDIERPTLSGLKCGTPTASEPRPI